MEELNSVEVVEALVVEIEKKLKTGGVKETEADLLPKLRASISKLPVLNRQDTYTLRKTAYDFWNLAVEMGQKKVTTGDLNPKMRQIACNMLTLSAATDDVDPETIQTILKFFARTGKSWSGRASVALLAYLTVVELGNYPLAENCWNNALEYWDTVKEKKQFNEIELAAVRQHIFTLFCWRSEAAWDRNLRELSFELAMKAASEACETVQWTCLSVIAYNFGVQLHRDEAFDEAAKWLERSVDWLEKDANKDASKQARTLRLLCNCYISRGNFEKASRCVEMANMEESTCAGLYLLLKIRMLQKQDSATILLFELLNHADCNFELASAALKMAIDNKWEETIGRVFQYLSNKFANTNVIEKLKFLEFEYHLVSANNVDAAMSTLENVIAAHNLGQAKLSTQTLRQFHFLIWNTAIGYFKQSEYQRAIEWLVRCNRLLGPEDNENRAQCLRILSRCYLSIQDTTRALEYALQAEAIEPKNPTGLLLLFELYLRVEKEKELVELLGRISKVMDQPQKFLELCSQKSMEKGRRTTAIHVLEHLMHAPFASEFDGHFAMIARTLIQLYLKEETPNTGKLLEVMKSTLSKGQESSVQAVFGGDKEVTWLSSTAWNMGVHAAKAEDYEGTYQFLSTAHQLLGLLEKTPDILTMQRTCLLVNVQALIDLEKNNKVVTNNQRAQLALQLLNEVKQINDKIQSDKMETDAPSEEDNLTALLLQYEFELHVLLGDDVPQKIITQSKAMPNVPASFFLMLSAVAANHPHYTQCATDSLKIAFDLLSRDKDYQQACSALRSTIKLTKDREQSVKLFLDGLDIVSKHATDTPQFMTEVKWLLANAYNNGVYYWRLNRYEQAEKWIGLAMKFMNCLSAPEKSCFESEIMNSYSTVLAKLK